MALTLWKNSAGHDAVIVNIGSWTDRTWNALGVSVAHGIVFAWFGGAADPLEP